MSSIPTDVLDHFHDIADADEALKAGLDALDAREARFAPVDECTLAKQEAEAAL